MSKLTVRTQADGTFQRVYQKTPKSCFAACVASIIGVEFEDMPLSFHAETWDHAQQRYWLSERGWGLAEHKMATEGMWPPTDGMLCIVSGKSPRGEQKHAVVAKTQYDTVEPFVVVHDPWRGDAFTPNSIDGDVEIVTWLIPMGSFRAKGSKS